MAYFGKQIASVVNYLHQNNLLHLDIKPSNIISQPPLAKLFDLNLVTTPGTIRKGTGTSFGRTLTYSADVRGVGVELFFMATGERPFKTYDDKRYVQLEHSTEDGNILFEMIDSCLDPVAENRPATVDVFRICEKFIILQSQ
ncbi:protein kinase domain-containing protein [Salinicoccus halodurans]|uniref:protein kinase domain-containing protein n=1 Tax=Salinicoccus halodurans TaxID=407035 RepID=UPI00069AC747|nr:hypothetical protein [Salinicoccus halodurans]